MDGSMILFGKYELGRLLGCGAFAKVYYGREIRSGKSVAVKVINKKKLSSSSLVSNIKREISIMCRLNHPYIVKLHEVLATKSYIYFVMDLVKGGELFAKVSKAGRFPEDVCRNYFQQLISAVEYCQARGVFHRDLKPENLLVDENGDLKVSDFGLSALVVVNEDDEQQKKILLHTLCGTPAYVAPEILSKKGYEGAKVDVWSCGVVLFVLSAGYLPFTDPNLMAMYKKIYKGEYRCPKWMSSHLTTFLSRLLDPNPETRITLDQIKEDPWFKQGGGTNDLLLPTTTTSKETSFDSSPCMSMNAFDLISFSSGLNLSGLFEEEGSELIRWFVSDDYKCPLEKVEEIAKAENLRLVKERNKKGVELEGRNGNLMMMVEVYGLTERLVVVEARRTGGDGKCYKTMWNNKIRPLLLA